MTLRTNSVSYGFGTSTTALTAATRLELAAVTVVIAETSSRTIRSAYVEVSARGTETSATSLTSRLFGIRVDGGTWNDVSTTETIPNSGDQQSIRFRRDVTSFLQTNFTGSSHSVQIAVQFGGLPTINICARLWITYEYDDASASTRTKTVLIPIESATGTLTTTLAELGTNQVPRLTGTGGFIREASPTIRDIYFIVMANEGHTSGTTDFALALALDAEAETQFGLLEQALDSSPFMDVIWKRTDINTESAHAFKARSTVNDRFPQIGALMVVTYTYNHAATTKWVTSVQIPLPMEHGAFGGTTATQRSLVSMKIPIEAPGTITLMQSGIWATYNEFNVQLQGLNVAVGSQSYRTYAPSTLYNSPAGQQFLMHRFDSGAIAGQGITLARGENDLRLAYYRTSTTGGAVGAGWTSVAILNYESDLAPEGSGVHNHTTFWCVGGSHAVGASTVYDYAAFAPVIPESEYWITGIGFRVDYLQAGRGTLVFKADRQAGESIEDGWEDLLIVPFHVSNELSAYTLFCEASRHYDRHPADPSPNRLVVESSRVYRLTTFPDGTNVHGGWASTVMLLTYHAIKRTVNGTSTGYTGDGSGITVNIRRVDTGALVYQTTTTTGGAYTFTAYSNNIALFAEARQDDGHVARSGNFTPG